MRLQTTMLIAAMVGLSGRARAQAPRTHLAVAAGPVYTTGTAPAPAQGALLSVRVSRGRSTGVVPFLQMRAQSFAGAGLTSVNTCDSTGQCVGRTAHDGSSLVAISVGGSWTTYVTKAASLYLVGGLGVAKYLQRPPRTLPYRPELDVGAGIRVGGQAFSVYVESRFVQRLAGSGEQARTIPLLVGLRL